MKPIKTRRGRRTIIEFGCGLQPWPNSIGVEPDRRALGPNDDYYGIDTYEAVHAHREIAQAYLDARRHLLGRKFGSWTILRESASNLPFNDGVVDEVIAINFFGDKGTKRTHNSVAREIARVLRPTGLVTIVETYSSDMPLRNMCDLMNSVGLRQRNSGHEHIPHIIRQYSNSSTRSRDDEYIALFGFPSEPPQPVGEMGGAGSPDVGGGDSLLMQMRAGVIGSLAVVREALDLARAGQRHLIKAQETLAGASEGSDNPIPSTIQQSLAAATEGLDRALYCGQTCQERAGDYLADLGVPPPDTQTYN